MVVSNLPNHESNNGSSKKRVGILLEQHFEDSEFKIPYNALKNAGAEVIVLGTRMNDQYDGKRGTLSQKPDATATEVQSEDFDAIVIPGGQAPDRIRRNPNAVRLVMDAIAQERWVAAVCHGPQVLIEADQLQGKRATGYRSIRKDLQNAGANYIDEAVVVDGSLITSRQPSDLPLVTITLLSVLGFSVDGSTPPDVGDRNVEWWRLAESWGGSSRQDLINTLNTAMVGEQYTLSAFRLYDEWIKDSELRLVMREVCLSKESHITLLENRLKAFDEGISWQVASVAGEAYATLQGWLHTCDDLSVLRRALGDVQTGWVDAYHLASQVTDPNTAEVLEEIGSNLLLHEQRLADFYRARRGRQVQPPTPTTVAIA